MTPPPAALEYSGRFDELIDQAQRLRQERPGAALQFAQQAHAMAVQSRDERAVAASALCVGDLRVALADLGDDLVESLRQCVHVTRALGDVQGESNALSLLAGVLRDRDEPAAALDALHQDLTLRRRRGDAAGEAVALAEIGRIHHDTAQFTDALKYLFLSLEVAESADNAPAAARALVLLGAVLVDVGDPERAMEFQWKALALARRSAEAIIESAALTQLGEVMTQIGQAGAGLQHLRLALDLARASQSQESIGRAELALGLATQALQDWQPADRWLTSALHAARRTRRRRLEVDVMRALAENRQQQGVLDAATELLHNALRMASELQAPHVAGPIHLQLSQVYERQGRFEQALHHCRQQQACHQRISGQVTPRRLRGLLSRAELERAHHEADEQRLLNQALADALDAAQRAEQEKQALVLQLSRQTELLEQLAREDGLTGLANRRWLDTQLVKERERARRFNHPLSVAMIDLDHFKSINDRFSHSVGDEVLRTVARILRDSCRLNDVLGRFGGEEFMLILVETSLPNAATLCEKLRSRIQQHDWAAVHPELGSVTMSVGLATDGGAQTAQQLVDAADQQLYRAKREGRNRVCCENPAYHAASKVHNRP